MDKEDPNALVEVAQATWLECIERELGRLQTEMAVGDDHAALAHANQIARCATALAFELRAKMLAKTERSK